MVTTAIICEFNPFHNGHKYLMDTARRVTQADFIIAIMSGNFVQRGEPAIIDKWARTKACLKAGADLVVELPCFASFAPANLYAYYGVRTAHDLGIVDYLVFGSETGRTAEDLQNLADKLDGRDDIFTTNLKENLDTGKSYASCVAAALGFTPGANDILGIEYIRALRKLDSSIIPFPIERISGEKISSAADIRSAIKENKDISNFLPEEICHIPAEEIRKGRGPVFMENFEQAIMMSLRSKTYEEIAMLPYVSEGLEYAIYKNACSSTSLDSFLQAVTCARYTKSRIRRICLASMLGIKRDDLQHTPGYIKVLGLRKSAGKLLNILQENSKVPIGTSTAKMAEYDKHLTNISRRITDVYTLGYPNPSCRIGDLELTHSAVFE